MPHYRYQPKREKLLKGFQIQKLLDFRNRRTLDHRVYHQSDKVQCPLPANEWTKLRIDQISQETHNSRRFTLALPNGMNDRLNLTVPHYLSIRGRNLLEPEHEVIHKYTPVSDSLFDGHIEFVIKCYSNGALTPFLFTLHEGDSMEVYRTESEDKEDRFEYPFADKTRLGMIAGGTGITPMIQVLKEMALHSEHDTRSVDLLYANQTAEDYLCQSDLMSLKAIMKERLEIYDFFERIKQNQCLLPNSWNSNLPRSGRIDTQSMKTLLPPPSEDTLIMLCGTPGMKEVMYGKKDKEVGRVFDGHLAKLGYTPEMIHVF